MLIPHNIVEYVVQVRFIASGRNMTISLQGNNGHITMVFIFNTMLYHYFETLVKVLPCMLLHTKKGIRLKFTAVGGIHKTNNV